MTGKISDPAALARRLRSAARVDPANPGSRSTETYPRQPRDCGELALRIARDGTWFYHGSPISRKSLARLFSTVLRREADGSYWLVTPAERGRIAVDDAPFTAVALSAAGSGRDQTLAFRTNLDDEVVADAAHPIRVAPPPPAVAAAEGGTPYVMVRDGLEALIVRSVYYELVDLGMQESFHGESRFGVWSAGCFFSLGSLEDAA